jgi:acetyl-CoA C-acetyltransferase
MTAYIYDGVRTPFGRNAGALSRIRPDDLLAATMRVLLDRNPFQADDYEDIVMGCACQAGEDARNVARHAGLRSGLPVKVAGVTINRLCGSGLAAILDASRALRCGEGSLFLSGGVESMTRSPFVVAKSESAFGRDFKVFDSAIGARFPNPRIEAEFGDDTMPQTADNIARQMQISREDSDRFAARSQALYAKALADGFYEGELCTIEVPQGRKQPPLQVSADEHPRPQTNLEGLAKLGALFEGGVVTAGNASGINDGAIAMILGNQAIGEKYGVKPRARVIAGAVAGVEPRLMGLGPVPAIEKALERTGLTLADLDVIEINEAFATQVLGCAKLLKIDYDDPRLNPNGGAIAVGHPLGASGGRLALTALRQLERTGGRYAVVSLCIGMGQGVAAIIERLDRRVA